MMMMMMNLQSAAAAQSTSAVGLETFYLEDYLDCVENLPEDLQRNISHMRELDATYQEILRELESYQLNLQGTEEAESGLSRKRLLLQIQRSLIQSQEIFDEKLQIAQQILDTIENKSRQLDVDYRNIGMRSMNFGGGRENENSELTFSKVEVQPERSSKRARRQRNECLGQGDGKPPSTATLVTGMAIGSIAAREDHSRDAAMAHQHQGSDSKMTDSDEKDRERLPTGTALAASAAASVMSVGGSASSSSAGVIVPSHHASATSSMALATVAAQPSSSSSMTTGGAAASAATSAPASAAAKKTKKKKRRSKAEMHTDRHQTSFSLHLRGDASLAGNGGGGTSGSGNGGAGNSGNSGMASLVVDDPLIDPDEPTYCLCQQISYGEMIGCDNDRCSIEWFHFSCVGLTTKPKGKWFCPRCRGDRPNVPRPGVRA